MDNCSAECQRNLESLDTAEDLNDVDLRLSPKMFFTSSSADSDESKSPVIEKELPAPVEIEDGYRRSKYYRRRNRGLQTAAIS